MSFIHFHRHSEFSRLDGIGTAKEYAVRAAELGQGALAQTDHGTLSGALHHIEACKNANILPISGVEAYFRPIRQGKMTRQAWHLCLFAKNLKGWHNLLRICSIAYAPLEESGGFYQYPCVDWDLLERYHEGLICSSACISSWLSKLIQGGDDVAVSGYVDRMLNIFGEDFWLEIMPHDFDDQRTLNKEIARIAQERSIPLLATNDAHFPVKEWADTHRVAKMMGSNTSFEQVKKDVEKGKEVSYLAELNPNLYLASREEMSEWFAKHHPDIPKNIADESLDNTGLLLQKFTPFILDKSVKLPKVTENPDESEKILKEWIEEGFERERARWPDEQRAEKEKIYQDRVRTEFEVLKNKGVLDYFVMVGEVCRWAKNQGIRVGLGRGSAAGCLVSYLIGIVAIDPIAYGLLFERFLNPERKGLPDIDLDFDSEKRGLVKQHIADKYGEDHVADIITHARFQPKSVLQDLCRTYDVPYIEAHSLTDTIDIRQDDEETTLEELLPTNDKLQDFKEKYPHIWEHALRLEGSVKNAGKHAAGIIITPTPIADYMALERGKKGDLVTSWSDAADFPVVSDYGFVKLDALGIKGLTRHDYACRLIEKRTGEKVDLNSLPVLYDPSAVDKDVLEGFTRGYTIGIFQFGGKGISDLIRSIEPDSILDLAAANALYRPGPMKGGVTWEYAKRKKGESDETYWHEIVRPILGETFGLVAYQEQVMEISKQIGGFTGAQADDLRKAMGKLYRIKGGSAAKDFMAQYVKQWFEGAKERGIEKAVADEIWHKILEFGHYGFNKSHSASYALQAYQDMYLKMKYPLEFYSSILTYPSGSKPAVKEQFIQQTLREARSRGIKILPPDVNKSGKGWTVDPMEDALRYGLMGIKGCGPVAAEIIIDEREKNGIFYTVDELRERCGTKVNKSRIEALTESGALDEFGMRLGASDEQISAWEKDRLKMSITVLPGSSKYGELIRANIYTQDEVAEADKGHRVIIGGEVGKVTRKQTKKGDPFANVVLNFEMNEWNVKFWKGPLASHGSLLQEGKTIMVSGTKDEWNGYISVVAEEVTAIEALAKENE